MNSMVSPPSFPVDYKVGSYLKIPGLVGLEIYIRFGA